MRRGFLSASWYLAPAALAYGLLFAIPTAATFPLSLYDWSGVGSLGPIRGGHQFAAAARDPRFQEAFKHNVYIFIALLIFQLTASLGIALMLNSIVRGRSIYLSVLFLPFMISPLAVGFIWVLMFDPNIGIVNPFLHAVHLGVFENAWLGNPNVALYVLLAALAWQWNGLAVILFLAGLQKVPKELGDAARVDGAGPMRYLRDVILPYLTPALTSLTVLLFVYAFRAFDLPFVLGGAQGAPDGATYVIGTSIYTSAFGAGSLGSGSNEFSYAVAQGVIAFVVILTMSSVVVLAMRRVQRRVFG